MQRVMIVIGLVAIDAEAENLVRKHQSDQNVTTDLERDAAQQTSMEVGADGHVEILDHLPSFVRKHLAPTTGQIDADGSVMISNSLVESTTQQTSIKEPPAYGNVENSEHIVDATRKLSPHSVLKHQASTLGQIAADDNYVIPDGLVDVMPQRSEGIVRKAMEGHVVADSSQRHTYESPVPMPTPSTDSSNVDMPIALPKPSGQLSQMAEKSQSSITPKVVQSLLFWEIDGNDDGRVDATECQAFVHKPRCQHCLKGLFEEQNIENKTELEVKLCADLGVVNESTIDRTDFMQALKQTAAALMDGGSKEHRVDSPMELDELDDLNDGWDCG